jgi:PP-loop superfamily ATP-utilizing enzyme
MKYDPLIRVPKERHIDSPVRKCRVNEKNTPESPSGDGTTFSSQIRNRLQGDSEILFKGDDRGAEYDALIRVPKERHINSPARKCRVNEKKTRVPFRGRHNLQLTDLRRLSRDSDRPGPFPLPNTGLPGYPWDVPTELQISRFRSAGLESLGLGVASPSQA